MPRIYFLQHWFDLSDQAVEEALCDSQAMRRLLASTSAASRCPMRRRCAAFAICWSSTIWATGCSDEVHRQLAANGLKVATGTIVDATTSTMSQTRFITHLQKEPLQKPAAMIVI